MKKSKIQCRTRIVTAVLTAAILLMSIIIPSSATTYKTSGNTTIEPSKSSFRDARKTVYSRLIETISDSIGSAYDTHIYHYRAPRSGDYIIYTEGSTDTVGRVFYETTFDWKPICTSIDDVSGTNRSTSNNFFVKLHLTAGEDYYIAIRGYNKRTGSYKLHIEPYRDKCVSNIGGFWYNYNRTQYTEGVYSVEYLTADQAAAVYAFISNATIQALVDNYYISIGTEGIIAKAFENKLTELSLIELTGITSVIPGASQFIGISSIIMDLIVDSMYYDTSDNVQLLGEISRNCGLTSQSVYTVINGKGAYGYVYSCTRGLRLQKNVEVNYSRSYILSMGGWVYFPRESVVFDSAIAYCVSDIYGGDFTYGGWVVGGYIFPGDITISY